RQGAAAVIIGGRRMPKIDETAVQIRQMGVESMPIQIDISKSDSVKNAFELIVDKFGKIDVLVNGGGVCLMTPFDKINVEEWDLIMQTNLFGTFICTQKAIEIMVAKKVKGSIVNISSIAGKVGGLAVGAHYAASKAGIICVTMSAAKYAAKFGIRVNAVAPGPIANDMTCEWDPNMKDKLIKTIPLGEFGRSEDVAEAIVFLASSKARYITGETIDVNGGALMD
ncbi:MAG TPA: SDR family oxidoreductase, partial [Sedimentisphaerales bacterium]